MQGLILAAGMGVRLGALTAEQTKGMVRVNGRPIVERAILALVGAGVHRVVVVLGHGGHALRSFLLARFPDLDLCFVENPDYATTNNIYSLWLARQHLLADDTLLLESDVVFEPDLVKAVVRDPAVDLGVVAPYEPWMKGTVLTLDEKGCIHEMVPHERIERARAGAYYKTVNLYLFSRGFSESVYVPHLEAFIVKFGDNQYYENVLAAITDAREHDLAAHLFEGDWYEIDDPQDLEVAETLFAEPEEKLARLQACYGGYWRYPKLLDFCYLVNPYFPPGELHGELEANSETLLGNYPSGQRVQANLAATAFDVSPDRIVVGNGASELIRWCMRLSGGAVGIVCPAFNEYLDSPTEAEMRLFFPRGDDFAYTGEELAAFGESLDTLILANPNNPTGVYLPRREVLDLARGLAPTCTLVVDESFVDFAEESGSLLSDGTLEEHPNLVVLRSLGKSHGIPGARLGVMASADSEWVERVRRELPVWNINAYGEFVLQALPGYRGAYTAACDALRRERRRLAGMIEQVPFLRVLSSQANFFLCRVLPPFTSMRLACALLDECHIFIKDCAGKPGFGDGQYIRLSIRNRADNDRLLAALDRVATR